MSIMYHHIRGKCVSKCERCKKYSYNLFFRSHCSKCNSGRLRKLKYDTSYSNCHYCCENCGIGYCKKNKKKNSKGKASYKVRHKHGNIPTNCKHCFGRIIKVGRKYS